MQEFIHMFSLERRFSKQEFNAFKTAFGPEYFFEDGNDKQRYVMSKYADNGMKMKFSEQGKKELKYDQFKRKYKATIIITPHKLLTLGKQMGKLINKADIQAACEQLKSIISDIQDRTGVNLWEDAKICQVDIAKDVLTPSDLYSTEIIKASKQAIHNSIYKVFHPEEKENYKSEWPVEDFTLFYNHSLGAEIKIYNVLHDLSEAEREDYNGHGLIRFELTLKFIRLKARYGIDEALLPIELPDILCDITEQGSILLDDYIVQDLYPDAMLSRSVLKKYLKHKNGKKKKRTKNMLDYSLWVTKNQPGLRDIGIKNAESMIHFKDLSVSPIYVSAQCPYIPSFSEMINNEYDPAMLSFAYDAVQGKQTFLDYWTCIW